MNSVLDILARSWRAAASPFANANGTAGSPVHVLDQEARVRLDDGMLLIERPDTKPVRLRLFDVLSVSLHGPAGITTPLVHALLAEGIPVIWRSPSGYYLGQTLDLSGRTARTRRAQYNAQGMPLAIDIAPRLVAAKLLNMRALLRRRGTDGAAVAPISVAGRAC
jgi:CRISPR/Cas system-associated endonuclease Cas1